jgi:uncharacterized PurR-regulated membrane protein YhhQ (DUF165 family)
MKTVGVVAAIMFVATVWFANYAVNRWGIVDVGFGYMAPAAAYFAGLGFTLRDIVHRTLGRWMVLICIAAGGALSLLVSTRFAVASAVAFAVSESCDLAVYEPLRSRGWIAAVTVSNIVGLVVDSLLFLWIAFGSLAFLEGQVIAKLTTTAAAIVVLGAWSATRRPVPA